jgi:hypothetical protein
MPKIRGKTIDEWTVENLKKALKKRKFPVSGRKKDLFIRLKESYKPKRASLKIAFKTINTSNSLFRFYASLYYQKPNSIMAYSELSKYGLSRSFLDSFPNHVHLFKALN